MIIDTDAGYDDLLAILLLMAQGVTIDAFTVVNGISNTGDGADALLRMQELLQLPNPIPVYKGEDGSHQPNQFPDQWRGQAAKLGWGKPQHLTAQTQSAAAFLSQTFSAAQGPVSLLAIGPFSNLAAALPSANGSAMQMIIMGGAINVPGNLPVNGPVAEANMYIDPPAAATLMSFTAAKPFVTLAQVPLDACYGVPIDDGFVNSFAGLSGVNPNKQGIFNLAVQILRQIQQEFIDANPPEAYFAYDFLAAAAVNAPGVGVWTPTGIAVGPDGQNTMIGMGAGSQTLACKGIAGAFIEAFFPSFTN